MFHPILICFIFGISLVSANVEKTIFLGPEPVNIPQQSPSLSDLNIGVLTPENWSLRSYIDAVFPTEDLKRGIETWLILDNLTEGQRYEVRVCWLATQPTAFHLETFTLQRVFETPDLITSLYNYSMSRTQHSDSDKKTSTPSSSSSSSSSSSTGERDSSILFLRVSAAAEYFTLNSTLMNHPEPVLTDLILDPFLFNLLPRTLVPTVCYIVFVAVASWVLGTKFIKPWLTGLVVNGEQNGQEQHAPKGLNGGREKKLQ